MKKILFISYMFPPVGGGGVVRITKFAKYLPQLGWQLRVVSVKKAAYPIEDKSLLAEIPKEVKISRVNYFDPALWFTSRYWRSFFSYLLYPLILVPDRYVLWFLPALIKALKVVKEENIQVVFTSSSSYTDHIVALFLKKFTRIKWVADFRDEWTTNPFFIFPTLLHRRLAEYLEKKVVNSADLVIAVSDPMTEFFQTLTDKKDKCITITNGFDPADFLQKKLVKNKKFEILYAGSLYGAAKDNQFEQAVSELKLKDLKVTFLGTKNRVDHILAVKRMREASVLLLILAKNFRPGVFTGKLFEYLAARRPILALSPEGTAASKLIKKLKVGEIVSPGDKEAIKTQIVKLHQRWESGNLPDLSADISLFNRQKLTEKLAAKLNDLVIPKGKKIRLCLIGDGNSSHNQKFCHELLKRGVEVHFITHIAAKIPGVRIHRIFYDDKSSLSPWYYFRSVLAVRRIIKKIKPNIIHGQYLLSGGVWADLSGFSPRVMTAWGSDILLFDQFDPIKKILIKRAIKGVDLVTGDALTMLDKMKEIGVSPKRYEEFIFGIDLENFQKKSDTRIRRKLGLKNEKVIFCPRSIKPVYNIDVLIKAFQKTHQNNKNTKLALIGHIADKDYDRQIRKLIVELKLTEEVIFFPVVENNQMVEYYNLAEIVVSIPSSDACSVSFLEALACEKKILMSNLPYLNEWKRGRNFWVTPVGNIKKTALLIQEMLEFSESKFEKTGRLNRKLIEEKAEINRNMEKMIEWYRELV